MKWLTLLAVLCLVGCGAGSTSSVSTQPPPAAETTIQQGQWEFDFQPPVGVSGGDSFMEVNLQVTGTQFYAPTNGVTGYEQYFNPNVEHSAFIGPPFPNGYIKEMCENDTVSGSTSSNFVATVADGTDVANLTATISGANVTSFSGQWSANVGGHEPWQCLGDGTASSTFTATAIAPLNGTFAGTLQTSSGSTDQITMTISQNVYTLSASGTATGYSLSISQADIIGALVYSTYGVLNSINGNLDFTLGGHIHADGKSVDVVIQESNGTVEWGTLTHQ
jgi:hypothetical protein